MDVSTKCKTCENTPGSYLCIDNIDPRENNDHCENNVCENAVCNPISNQEYECICSPGFVALNNITCRLRDCRDDSCLENEVCREVNLSFECYLFDPCEINNGDCSHTCSVNLSNSAYPICTCPENQIILADSKSCGCPNNTIMTEEKYCRSISFCEIKNGNCEQVCENSQNGCSCFEGFKIHNLTHCEDIDECLQTNICDQECLNTFGSFQCKCSEGYSMNNNTCEDINECEMSSPCQYECSNFVGGFKCHCPEDFILNKDNLTCTKLYKLCQAPTTIENGVISCKTSSESLECNIACNDGYVLQGSEFNVCHNDEWNNEFPQCVRKFVRLNNYF